MCTIVLAWKAFDNAPVCLAMNRDEAPDRTYRPPSAWDRPIPIVAPRDIDAGGTWLGYNAAGVTVAVTNRWQTAPDGDRSRGQLVLDALAERSAEAAVERIQAATAHTAYAPFHLVCADRDHAAVVIHEGPTGGTRTRSLTPGIHVIVNVGTADRWIEPTDRPAQGRQQARQAQRLTNVLTPSLEETAAEWLRRAGDCLSDHEYGRCLHGAKIATRSSSLLRVGGMSRWRFAAGPPCRTPYATVAETVG